jgi:hypothetical protein
VHFFTEVELRKLPELYMHLHQLHHHTTIHTCRSLAYHSMWGKVEAVMEDWLGYEDVCVCVCTCVTDWLLFRVKDNTVQPSAAERSNSVLSD